LRALPAGDWCPGNHDFNNCTLNAEIQKKQTPLGVAPVTPCPTRQESCCPFLFNNGGLYADTDVFPAAANHPTFTVLRPIQRRVFTMLMPIWAQHSMRRAHPPTIPF